MSPTASETVLYKYSNIVTSLFPVIDMHLLSLAHGVHDVVEGQPHRAVCLVGPNEEDEERATTALPHKVAHSAAA